MSHHRDEESKIEQVARIDKYLVMQFAYLLDRLKSIPEGEGTLLDNCMLLYGSAIADGNRHDHHDLPILLAGRGGGTIRAGRYIRHPDNTPLNNLFLSLTDRVGAGIESIGDSTGRLELA